MLTWLLGLMGTGLIAGIPLLKNAPVCARFGAVAPWLVGIFQLRSELRREIELLDPSCLATKFTSIPIPGEKVQ